MPQTRFNSLIESIISALLAAPTAMLLHKELLVHTGACVTGSCQDQFVAISWIIFLGHSIIWKFIIRRTLVTYKCENLTSLFKKCLKL